MTRLSDGAQIVFYGSAAVFMALCCLYLVIGIVGTASYQPIALECGRSI